MQTSATILVATALCLIAFGATETTQKEARFKNISMPNLTYNSTSDKVLRFVMIKTADTPNGCEMDGANSFIYLTLDGNNHERCNTNKFTHPPGDFTLGALDAFQGDILGNCGSTQFPSGLFQFEIIHHGESNDVKYCPEYIILIFNDGTMLECQVNVPMNYDDSFRCVG